MPEPPPAYCPACQTPVEAREFVGHMVDVHDGNPSVGLWGDNPPRRPPIEPARRALGLLILDMVLLTVNGIALGQGHMDVTTVVLIGAGTGLVITSVTFALRSIWRWAKIWGAYELCESIWEHEQGDR